MGRPLLPEYSPAMVLPVTTAHHHFPHGSNPFASSFDTSSSFRPARHSQSFAGLSGSCRLASASSTPLYSNPSRKRSRDEFNTASSTEASFGNCNSTTTDRPVHDEDAMLMDCRNTPAPNYSLSGTWFEKQMKAAPASSSTSATPHTDHRGRKSQRVTVTTATTSSSNDLAGSENQYNSKLARSSSQPGLYGSPCSSISEEPLVDNFTQLLGISWQRFPPDDDPDMAAAIRGWEKFIDNRFARHIQNARIVLKHRGLNAYLVTSRPTAPLLKCRTQTTTTSPFREPGDEGIVVPSDSPSDKIAFYLFDEDLMEGRLVANDWDTCIQQLRTSPITFAEGSEVLGANGSLRHPPRQQDNGVKGDDGADAIAAGWPAKNCGAGWDDWMSEIAMDID